MRLTKNEKHPHLAKKFVKHFCIFPRFVQQQWIWFEHYYIGYSWDVTDRIALQEKIGYSRAIDAYVKPIKGRFSEYDFMGKEIFDKTTHSWKEFEKCPRKLPEDVEVSKWLLDNSPLNAALKE